METPILNKHAQAAADVSAPEGWRDHACQYGRNPLKMQACWISGFATARELIVDKLIEMGVDGEIVASLSIDTEKTETVVEAIPDLAVAPEHSKA
jgi:hypothetical protein